MLCFGCMASLQKFAAVHAAAPSHFNEERHLYSRKDFKLLIHDVGATAANCIEESQSREATPTRNLYAPLHINRTKRTTAYE